MKTEHPEIKRIEAELGGNLAGVREELSMDEVESTALDSAWAGIAEQQRIERQKEYLNRTSGGG